MSHALWLVLLASQLSQLPLQTFDNYSQWKLALQQDGLTQASFSLPEGFRIEAIRVATPEEGSWISLAFDPQGRLLVGREKQGIFRFALDATGKVTRTELLNDSVQEARGLLYAHDSLYVTANREKNIYRLRDSDGDDRFEKVELLKTLEGTTGHGRNGMALGPDGKIYIACGNNVLIPKDRQAGSPYQRDNLGRLLPCAWNEFLFDADVVPPCGWIGRFDAEGKNWEVVAGGFRNPYDLAFNEEGDLFTYDADMEWDVGAPWYRPTNVAHVVPGGEYGWRQGSSVWPDHFPDALPRVCDIGLGSPTGVAMGTKSRFPPALRKSLFICDWAYGRIIAVQLSPRGTSYVGKPELFLQGKPLNVADITFGPDGALWLVVGGRGTRSAVYRVKYTGEEVAEATTAEDVQARAWRQERREWEQQLSVNLTAGQNLKGRGLVLQPQLDPHLRSVVRRAIYREDPAGWREVVKNELPGDPQLLFTEALRLDLDRGFQPAVWIESLRQKRTPEENVLLLRTLQLRFLQTEPSTPFTPEQREKLKTAIEERYPFATFAENQLAVELLVYLESATVAAKTLPLMIQETQPERKLFYLFALRSLNVGWDETLRRKQLVELKQAETFPGAQYMPTFVMYIRSDSLASFSAEHRAALKHEMAQLGRAPEIPAAAASKAKVKDWSLAELTAEVEAIKRPANLKAGKELFVAAQCNRCHRLGGEGTMLGPDLTNVSSRFGRREMIESIVEPSKVIDGKYRGWQIVTSAGQAVTGQLVGGTTETLYVAADPLNLHQFQVIRRDEITSRKPSPVSLMPTGLANVLNAEEVYDLLSYIEQVK